MRLLDENTFKLLPCHFPAPSPPTNISITNITSTSALLQWSPPTFPNGMIQLYTVSVTSDLAGTRLLNSTTAQQDFLLESLLPFTEYSVVIYASNSIMGELSGVVQFTTLEDGEWVRHESKAFN